MVLITAVAIFAASMYLQPEDMEVAIQRALEISLVPVAIGLVLCGWDAKNLQKLGEITLYIALAGLVIIAHGIKMSSFLVMFGV